MSWLILVLFAILADSLRIFIDNYTADVYFKGKYTVSQKLFLGGLYIILGAILLLFFLPQADQTPINIILFLILSGLFSSIANIFYYRALEIDDSTNLAIFIQLSPILYLVLGWFFCGEVFSPLQLLAFAIIVSAPLLVIFTTRKNGRKTKFKAAFMACLFVVIAVIGNLIFVQANQTISNFPLAIAFMFVGKGLGDLAIAICSRRLYKRFWQVFHRSKGKVARPIFCNFATSVVKEFAYRGALVAAPAVAIASAVSDSAEPLVVFLMGIVLTLIWPKFGREKLTRKNVLIHLTSTIIIAVGVIILQFA